MSAYVAKAVAGELAELRAAHNGSRNNTLFKVAARLYEFVAAGALAEAEAEGQIEAEARALGLGASEIRATLKSARKRTSDQPAAIPAPRPAAAERPARYESLAAYAAARGADEATFVAAGWSAAVESRRGRPALRFTTPTGARWRFIDGGAPKYDSPADYQRCWYRLAEAIALAEELGYLALCNGEASAVAAQRRGVPALAIAGGTEKPTIPPALLAELRAAWGGPIVLALDCDQVGRTASASLRDQLAAAGYDVRAVDLGGAAGFDLADFCRLHEALSAAELLTLPDLGTDTPTDTPTDTLTPRFVIRTESELATLPPLEWLHVDEVIRRGYHLIYGASGSGKTFYAVRRAMRSAEAGRRVLYIATEDLTGLRQRVGAWRRAFPASADGAPLTWLDMPLGLDLQDSTQVEALLSTIRGHGYEHIVIDTLREAHSGDENSSQDGAAINRAVQRIIRETGAAVDVVHHSGVEDRRPRGTTAIFGNADMVLRVSKDEELITLHYDKIRNNAPLEDKRFALGDAAPGCFTPVLRPVDSYTRRDVSIGRVHKAILAALALSVFAETGAKGRDLLATAEGVTERTIYRALSDLKDKGFVSQGVKGDPYFITTAGRAQLLPAYVPATDTGFSPPERQLTPTDMPLTTTAVSKSDNPTELTDTDTTLMGVSVSQWSQSVESQATDSLPGGQPGDPLGRVDWRRVRHFVARGELEQLEKWCKALWKPASFDQVLADPRARAE